MIGKRQAYVDGRVYNLDWGHRHVTLRTEGETPVTVPLSKAMRWIASDSIGEFIKRFSK